MRPRLGWHLLLPAVAGLLLLVFAVPNVAPALRAARAEGVRGTFTAERLTCVQHPGHEQCTWYGRFRGDDRNREVTLYGATRASLRVGQAVTAIDVGRPWRVYPPSGSREWIVVAAVIAGAIVLLLPLATRLLHRRRQPGSVGGRLVGQISG